MTETNKAAEETTTEDNAAAVEAKPASNAKPKASKPAKTKVPESVKARVLSSRNIDGINRHPNEVITLPRDLAESLKSKGIIDTSAAGIEYAEKQAINQKSSA